MNYIVKIAVLVLVFMNSACTTVRDLDAPCTDFGRFCHQEPINVMGNSPCDDTRRMFHA